VGGRSISAKQDDLRNIVAGLLIFSLAYMQPTCDPAAGQLDILVRSCARNKDRDGHHRSTGAPAAIGAMPLLHEVFFHGASLPVLFLWWAPQPGGRAGGCLPPPGREVWWLYIGAASRRPMLAYHVGWKRVRRLNRILLYLHRQYVTHDVRKYLAQGHELNVTWAHQLR
jgi:hypothetical protein